MGPPGKPIMNSTQNLTPKQWNKLHHPLGRASQQECANTVPHFGPLVHSPLPVGQMSLEANGLHSSLTFLWQNTLSRPPGAESLPTVRMWWSTLLQPPTVPGDWSKLEQPQWESGLTCTTSRKVERSHSDVIDSICSNVLGEANVA
ncbi:unnamed protein product [Caretta caretta]